MEDREVRRMVLDSDTMKSIWFPPKAHKLIQDRAKAEGLTTYKYLLIASNNYEMRNDEDYKKSIK